MIYQNQHEKDLYDKGPDYGFGGMLGYEDRGSIGPNYTHSNHPPEDAFELPKQQYSSHPLRDEAPEYAAEYTGAGKAVLVLYTPSKIIAYFDTYADAQTAAQALNELKGY